MELLPRRPVVQARHGRRAQRTVSRRGRGPATALAPVVLARAWLGRAVLALVRLQLLAEEAWGWARAAARWLSTRLLLRLDPQGRGPLPVVLAVLHLPTGLRLRQARCLTKAQEQVLAAPVLLRLGLRLTSCQRMHTQAGRLVHRARWCGRLCPQACMGALMLACTCRRRCRCPLLHRLAAVVVRHRVLACVHCRRHARLALQLRLLLTANGRDLPVRTFMITKRGSLTWRRHAVPVDTGDPRQCSGHSHDESHAGWLLRFVEAL